MNDSRESNLTATPNVSFHKMEYKIVLSALLGLIIVVSLLANILVCLVILSTRPLRQSNDACFVLSVAVSDLLTTCLVIPFDLELIVSDSTEWRHGEIMCNVFTTAYLLTVPKSILSLLALSVYRYIKLKNPLDHVKLSPLITKRRVMADHHSPLDLLNAFRGHPSLHVEGYRGTKKSQKWILSFHIFLDIFICE